MNRHMKPLALLISLLFASTASADKIRGTIDVVKASYGTTEVIFSLIGKDNKLSCSGAKRYGFDSPQPGGANIYAALLDAQTSGKAVKVITNDTTPCMGSENVQAIKYLIVGTEDEDKVEDMKEFEEKMKNSKEK